MYEGNWSQQAVNCTVPVWFTACMRKIIISMVDDVNGNVADETVEFGVEGVTYEIDLTEENAAGLRADLGPWIAAARRIDGFSRPKRSRKLPSKTGLTREDRDKIRDWAAANGIRLPKKGRIRADVVDQYYAAHAS